MMGEGEKGCVIEGQTKKKKVFLRIEYFLSARMCDGILFVVLL